MELPDPYKGSTRGQKATQWLDRMFLWVALHCHQFDKVEQMVVWILYHTEDKAAVLDMVKTDQYKWLHAGLSPNLALPLINNIIKGEGSAPKNIQALEVYFKEAFANPDTKWAAVQKIASLAQTTSTAEYVPKLCKLTGELDCNKEAYIAQFTRGLHWKVKELLSTKYNIPEELKAIFVVAIKIDNTCCKNEENCPKSKGKTLITATTSTTTTTH
ncbi:hypothetical protein RhiTH_010049 [Rhizoctonia solani]